MCGLTKGPRRHKETWWRKRDVYQVVTKLKVCHKSKSSENKHTLDVDKKKVNEAVLEGQEYKLQELIADLKSKSGRKNCFGIANQMARDERDLISLCCMKIMSRTLCLKQTVCRIYGEAHKC